MNATAEAEALLARLAEVAPEEDVAQVRAASTLEAARLRHAVVVPGHVAAILVRGGADAGLLRSLGVDPAATAAQLLDRIKDEVDAQPTVRADRGDPPAPCPACGDTGARRYETRRVPNPEGGRGAVMGRVERCGACGELVGPT